VIVHSIPDDAEIPTSFRPSSFGWYISLYIHAPLGNNSMDM